MRDLGGPVRMLAIAGSAPQREHAPGLFLWVGLFRLGLEHIHDFRNGDGLPTIPAQNAAITLRLDLFTHFEPLLGPLVSDSLMKVRMIHAGDAGV
jgi:hypothetical protein